MKPQQSFVAERAAAQHCPELLQRGPDPAELIPAMGRLGERLTRHLAGPVAALLSCEAIEVAYTAPAEIGEGELASELGALAANSLLGCAVPGVTLLAAVEGHSMLRLVDRAFGGRGEASGPQPEAFPLSAELLIQRLEELLATALGEALGQVALRPLRRDSRLSELAPFPAGARLAVLRLELAEGAAAPYRMLIAVPLVHLPKLLGQGEPRTPRAAGSANPAAAPFADVPLPVAATLVDMRVPLSTLATLEPGTVLPVAVSRAVPLLIGSALLARGTIGAQDDRVAVRLTQIA